MESTVGSVAPILSISSTSVPRHNQYLLNPGSCCVYACMEPMVPQYILYPLPKFVANAFAGANRLRIGSGSRSERLQVL